MSMVRVQLCYKDYAEENDLELRSRSAGRTLKSAGGPRT
jgi:hypothetical protein